jgi:glyoxylase-like metal-dependent hydrolase (beta-lactamase superfamily II)
MGSSGSDEVYVTVSALEAGQLTLPESLFITDADPEKRATVPSLSFLIQHPSGEGKVTKLVFDLGLKRDLSKYPPAQQAHIANRQPTILHPDCADSLRTGGLDPAKDIDIVILSHVHWDHEGTPDDFSNSEFVVGSGTLHLLANGAPPHYPKDIFNPDLLPKDRTKELPPTSGDSSTAAKSQTHHAWKPFAGFPNTVDFFGDGSVYVVDSPGHLFGHVNLLARLSHTKWVYLGGDCCHDPRILTGEKGIALYDDGHGGLRSVHVDTEQARQTLSKIGPLLKKPCPVIQGDGSEPVEVEVIVAHDKGWREKNLNRFFPGTL